ncbi:hypothetical protein BHM03_00051674, partial [Ensete ventricosum]
TVRPDARKVRLINRVVKSKNASSRLKSRQDRAERKHAKVKQSTTLNYKRLTDVRSSNKRKCLQCLLKRVDNCFKVLLWFFATLHDVIIGLDSQESARGYYPPWYSSAADKPLAAKQLTHAAKQPPSCAASAATQQHCRVTTLPRHVSSDLPTCLCVYMASAASGLSACVSR